MENTTKATLIGAAGAIIATTGAAWIALSFADTPPPKPASSNVHPLNSGIEEDAVGDAGREANAPSNPPLRSEPSNADDSVRESECMDLGDKHPGTFCIMPATGSPGEPFEVSGYDFPPSSTVYVIGEGANHGIKTNADGTFSETIDIRGMECRSYEYSFNFYIPEPLVDFSYETIGC